MSVFIWTCVYAAGSVLLTFSFGLFLAITLNKSGLRLRRLQRSLLIIPYAIPAFLSVLVWGGLLNDDFGLINRALGTDIPWLLGANWAKVSCLLVNFWLGFPYFFLICTGSLQAIPDELTEAARVDGASPRQVFGKVTLPLLLVAVAPLLIASFAFNFNNFNNIYFLTRGGPYGEDQVVAGSTDDLDENGIAVYQERAERDGLAIGDPVPVQFAETGDQELEVAMIFDDNDLVGTQYLIGRDAYEANFADQFDLQVYVIQDPDVTTEQARAAIDGVAEGYANAEVQDIEEFKQAQTDQINQFVAVIYVLLMLAVVIALFGIGNTLALSIIERTRELGLLRAVGMTRRQLRTTVRWEAILTSVFGTLLGLGIGLFFGWAIVEALKDEGLKSFVIPWGQLLIIVMIAALAGVVAAILPARRAAKLNILDAIADD